MTLNTVPGSLPLRRFDRFAKRALDVILAAICLFVLSPIMGIVALLVLRSSRGPVFYKQKRVGREGRHFDIYKFRTMCHGADKKGPAVTASDDSRITEVGRHLRNWKIDELPQLLNVLKGDMSLVGPRPQVPEFVELFHPEKRALVLRVRPGITGPTALRYRHEEQMLANRPDRETYYIDEILPAKLEMDVHYVTSRTLGNDVVILAQTAKMLGAGVLRRIVPPVDSQHTPGPGGSPRLPSTAYARGDGQTIDREDTAELRV